MKDVDFFFVISFWFYFLLLGKQDAYTVKFGNNLEIS